MRLGIISDTHGHVPFTIEAVRLLEEFAIEELVHCGDIGSADIPGLLRRWPGHFVLGNVDGSPEFWDEVFTAPGQTLHGRFGQLQRAGRDVAFLHGDDTKLLERTLASGQWDLVCHGHTHQSRVEWVGKTLSLNPGALFRARPRSLAVILLPELDVEIIPLGGP